MSDWHSTKEKPWDIAQGCRTCANFA